MFQEGIKCDSKTRYVISATLTTMSLLYDAGRISPRVTICSLPDEVLLDIFEFCLSDHSGRWFKLVHVCQRWRCIVFASPLRLDLRIPCTQHTPVRKMLSVWPPLLIEIDFYSVGPQVEDNIIAALKHPKRVRSVLLSRIMIPLVRLVAVMQKPFPELESLSLQIPWQKQLLSMAVPTLPKTFLGGSAPRLRSLHLERISYPTLPRLLLSSKDLVNLSLGWIPHSGYISPEIMATCLIALTRLTSLSIGFESSTSHSRTQHPPPLTRAVLPALTNFYFRGVSEYLEDLMAQIDAPLLHRVEISLFHQRALSFRIQQVPRFIGHEPALMPYYKAFINIYANYVRMTFSSRTRSSINEILTFEISCGGVLDSQVSSMAQICSRLSFILSSIEELSIDDRESVWQVGRVDDPQ
jgi:F-box-like